MEFKGVMFECLDYRHGDWAWTTLQGLFNFPIESHPGRDKLIEAMFKDAAIAIPEAGLVHAYANPAFLVTSSSAGRSFLMAARRAQSNWFSTVRQILGTSGSVHRNSKSVSPVIRQLIHTGVLIIDGKHIWPNNWPDRKRKKK